MKEGNVCRASQLIKWVSLGIIWFSSLPKTGQHTKLKISLIDHIKKSCLRVVKIEKEFTVCSQFYLFLLAVCILGIDAFFDVNIIIFILKNEIFTFIIGIISTISINTITFICDIISDITYKVMRLYSSVTSPQ